MLQTTLLCQQNWPQKVFCWREKTKGWVWVTSSKRPIGERTQIGILDQGMRERKRKQMLRETIQTDGRTRFKKIVPEKVLMITLPVRLSVITVCSLTRTTCFCVISSKRILGNIFYSVLNPITSLVIPENYLLQNICGFFPFFR